MKNRRIITFGVTGIVVLLLTIAIFVLTRGEDGNKSVMLGFAFLLYSEIVLFGGLIGIEILSSRGSGIVLRTGGGITLVLYTVFVAVSSGIYMLINTDHIKGFWILQIVLLAMCVISITVFGMTAATIKEKDDKLLGAVVRVDGMVVSLHLLEGHPVYGKQIAKLAENLKYTDTSTAVPVDENIVSEIAKLEMKLTKEEENEETEQLLERLAVLIKQRNMQTRDRKMGGI